MLTLPDDKNAPTGNVAQRKAIVVRLHTPRYVADFYETPKTGCEEGLSFSVSHFLTL